MSGALFKLVGRAVVECTTTGEWGQWFEHFDDAARVVRMDDVPAKHSGNVRVSTVFIGIALGDDEQGRPLVFESKVFGGRCDGETRKAGTWENAESTHASLLALVLATER